MYADKEPVEAFPEWQDLHFNDMEGSWHWFTLLEAYADGMGGWRIMDVIGKPLSELPEPLVEDLMTWRWLVGIAQRLNSKKGSAKNEQ